MKISFFYFYPFTIWTPGGGEVELKKTKEAVERLGMKTEFFDIWHPTLDCDILHIFGSSYQLSDFTLAAKKMGMRVIVSAIAYSWKPWIVWLGAKALDRIVPMPTVFNLRKKIYQAADIVIPGTKAEARQLQKYLNVPSEKIRIVNQGVDRKNSEVSPELFYEKFGLRDFVLTVGRINERKGQLRLIEALEGQNIDLVFIGSKDPSEMEYYQEFLQECSQRSWVHYLGPIYDEQMLSSAYAACKVHVLPSEGEFPGLVNLEAGIAGANVVAGYSEPLYEHLGHLAFYCNPHSLSSIKKMTLLAYNTPKNEELKKRLLTDFTWDRAGEKIVKIYEELLAKK